MVTFEMLFKMPTLRVLNAVAGQGGLTREIRAVSVMDAPDSYKWLKGGELILTSAYLYGGDTKFLELALMNLIEAGSSGLGIKKDRFLNKIPENIIFIADEHQFPIIEIPYYFGWSDIIAVFYELLHNTAENTHFTIDPNHIEQIYNAGRWGSRKLMDKLTELFRIPLAVLLNNKEIQMDNGLPGVKMIGGALENTLLFPENMGNEILTVGKYYLAIFNIPFLHHEHAEYLAIMSQNRSFFAEMNKLFHLLTDLGKQENVVIADKMQIYREFMLSFMSGKITTDEIHHFEMLHGSKETVYSCVILIYSEETISVYHKLADALKKPCLVKKGKASSYIVDNAAKHEAVVMLELIMKNDDDSYKEWQRMFIEEMEYSMQESQAGYISMGRLYYSLKDIMFSYWEAKEAHVIGQNLWENRRCFSYSMLSAYSVLRNANPAQIDLSYIDILDNNKTGLSFDGILTLEAYIECGSYKKAAEKLYLHENTLRYRMHKIQNYLHVDLDDPIITHSLIIQIKIWRLSKKDK